MLDASQHCQWEILWGPDENGRRRVRCPDCKIELNTRQPPERTISICNSKKPPSLARRGANYAKAQIDHLTDGMRRRTPARIEQLYNEHCAGCPMNIEGMCIHQECGCPIGPSPLKRNKLALASTECPLKLWGPEPFDSPHIELPSFLGGLLGGPPTQGG